MGLRYCTNTGGDDFTRHGQALQGLIVEGGTFTPKQRKCGGFTRQSTHDSFSPSARDSRIWRMTGPHSPPTHLPTRAHTPSYPHKDPYRHIVSRKPSHGNILTLLHTRNTRNPGNTHLSAHLFSSRRVNPFPHAALPREHLHRLESSKTRNKVGGTNSRVRLQEAKQLC